MSPDEVVGLAKARVKLLKQAREILRDYSDSLREATRTRSASGDPVVETWRDQMRENALEEQSAYNRLVGDIRRALAEVGYNSMGMVLFKGDERNVDVIQEATLTNKWGPSVLSQAAALIESAVGEWERIEKDPAVYVPPSQTTDQPSPSALADLTAELARLRADVDEIKKRRPWTREDMFKAAAALAALIGALGGATLIQRCSPPGEPAGAGHRPPDEREIQRPNQNPPKADEKTRTEESRKAVGHSITPPAPSASSKP